jgi:hypothetical protein
MFSKVIAAGLCVVLCITTVPVLAAKENQNVTEAGIATCEVTINADGTEPDNSFTVSIPKTISGTGTSGTLTYTVSVYGDLTDTASVTVQPDTTVTLKQENKDDVTASISQDKTVWTADNIDTDGSGSITYANLGAGTYKGTFNFTITLTTGTIQLQELDDTVEDPVEDAT